MLYDASNEAEHQSICNRYGKSKTASGYNLLKLKIYQFYNL